MLTLFYSFFARVFQTFLVVLLMAFIGIGMLATHGIYTAETTGYAQYRPQAEAECADAAADAADVALCVTETLADMGSVKLILGLGVSAGVIATIILVIWIRNRTRNRQKDIANKS